MFLEAPQRGRRFEQVGLFVTITPLFNETMDTQRNKSSRRHWRYFCAALLLVGASSASAQDLKSGLVAYWPLDEVRGSKTPDTINGLDMDLNNMSEANVVEGKFGSAFSFSNVEQTLLTRVHAPGEKLPAGQYESYTISMWTKVQGNGQNDLRVFSEGNTEDSNPLFNIGTQNAGSSGQVDFYLRQSGWATVGHIFSEQEPFDGTWNHIAFVQDNGARALYVNGQLDGLAIADKEAGEWRVNNTSIGGILRASASHWVTGLIDDVGIWDRALTQSELSTLAANSIADSTTPAIQRDLVSYWPLDEVRGSKTPDIIGGLDMDLNNMSADNVISDGYRGNAFSFSNEAQTLLTRIHAPGEDLPAGQHESYTISMWTRVEGNGQNDLRVFSEGNTEDSNPLFNIGTQNAGSSGQVDLFFRQSGWATVGHIFSEGEPFDGSWNHVVFVQDNGARALYINGQRDALEIPDKEAGEWRVNNTSIGGILRASASHWVTGDIDEVAIWKRALTEAEISGLADSSIDIVDPLVSGLVAHWPLDEVRGSKTPDVVNSLDMDLNNMTSANVISDGKHGNAMSFSNAEQTLLSRVHAPGELLPAGQYESYTISMWTRVEGNGQNDLRVFSEGNTEDSNPLFNIGTQNAGSSGQVDLFFRQSGWATVGHIFSEQEPFDGTWNNIMFVQDGASRKLYVNGVLDNLEIPDKEAGEWRVNNTSIGGILRASASHWVTGDIDDVAIWNRALTADEITRVVNEPIPAPPSSKQPLEIRFFNADFPVVAAGDFVRLNWETVADATVTLSGGDGGGAPIDHGDIILAGEASEAGFSVTWDAVEGQTYTVQATSDFSEWTTVAENFPEGGASGDMATFVDTDTSVGAKFYRIIFPNEGGSAAMDVNGNTTFGQGSIDIQVPETTVFTLTASRGSESVSASFQVKTVQTESGWRLLDNFDTYRDGLLSGNGNWVNPVGRATVVGLQDNLALGFSGGSVLGALDLTSQRVEEGEKRTLFFRTYLDAADDTSSQVFHLGLTEKPIRFVGDFNNSVGPFLRLDNGGGGGALYSLQARFGIGGALEIGSPQLEFGKIYNFWIDIENKSNAEGDVYSIYYQEEGAGARELVFENYPSDRDPAGSVDLGVALPTLTSLFFSVPTGSGEENVLFDDFYLSADGFVDTVPVPAGSFEPAPDPGYPEDVEFAFQEGFEDGANGWSAETVPLDPFPFPSFTEWELGAPQGNGPDAAANGSNVYGTDLDANFEWDTDARLRSPVINLAGVENGRLYFRHFLDCESSIDGQLFDFAQVNILDRNGNTLAPNVFQEGGRTDGWKVREVLLPLAAANREIILEFRFVSDNFDDLDFGPQAGWFIDDVAIVP